jgi:hypothetical protein
LGRAEPFHLTFAGGLLQPIIETLSGEGPTDGRLPPRIIFDLRVPAG